MIIPHNDSVKNISAEKHVNKTPKATKKEDDTMVKETTLTIKEEFKFSSKNKTGEIPSSPIFENPFMSIPNPVRVKQAKSIVDEVVELDFSDKAGLVKKSGDFTKSLQGMNNGELVEVADYIRHLMQETMGTDDILGGMQETVFDSMKSNFTKPFNFLPERFVINQPI